MQVSEPHKPSAKLDQFVSFVIGWLLPVAAGSQYARINMSPTNTSAQALKADTKADMARWGGGATNLDQTSTNVD